MTYEEKCEFAIKELEATGIWRWNYNPPIVSLHRMLGLKIPPPLYNSFSFNAISHGIYFGLAWGVLNFFFNWNTKSMSVGAMMFSILFTGAFLEFLWHLITDNFSRSIN